MPEKTNNRESRILRAAEARATKRSDGSFEVVGYAAKFNVVSHDLGGFVERIAPGAFARAISDKQDVTFLWMHRRETLMARTASGTLTLSEDANGLAFVANICDCSDGRDLFQRMSRNDVNAMSFTFRAVRDSWDFAGPVPVRTLIDNDLFDVSAVDVGAYPETELGLRSLADARAATIAQAAAAVSTRRARLRLADAIAADLSLG